MARPEPRRRKIGGLDSIEIQGKTGGPTVVLFHGYGADMHDLATLAEVVQAPKDTNWYFPNGHHSIPLGGQYEGRAWFPISVSELEKSMSTGQAMDFTAIVPPGMKKAREKAESFLRELGVPASKLVIGGFSQGAMLATDVTMHMKERPAGLALLSGTLVNSEEWKQLAPGKTGLRFFQSHGSRDGVLGFAAAQKLEMLLRGGGWQGQIQRFEGAHEIPPEVIIQLGAFLRKAFA
ncbi:MAG: esterase [Bdellovibrionota bacterium]